MSEVHTRTLGHIHYGLTEAEMRRKTGSNGNFHGPMPICGNGSWHAHTTHNPQNITCEKCKEQLAANPSYLSKVQ
jgi:hypothetical protein